jgi:hypothetical protein
VNLRDYVEFLRINWKDVVWVTFLGLIIFGTLWAVFNGYSRWMRQGRKS